MSSVYKGTSALTFLSNWGQLNDLLKGVCPFLVRCVRSLPYHTHYANNSATAPESQNKLPSGASLTLMCMGICCVNTKATYSTHKCKHHSAEKPSGKEERRGGRHHHKLVPAYVFLCARGGGRQE